MKARTIALPIALLCTNPLAHAQKTVDSRIYAPNELILGMTYGDWSAAWWQFYLQIPNTNNNHPFVPNANDRACHNGNQPDGTQHAGPVYFLAGVFAAQPVIRYCTVPVGTPILFPVSNDEFSNLEIANAGNADLRYVAFQQLALPIPVSVSLDGVSIGSLAQFRFESPVFPFTTPSLISSFIFYTRTVSPSNSSSPLAVSDGYWIAIKPLPAGQHTLSFSAGGSGGINNVYYLSVQ
jgi:hypothetical protein